MDRKDYEFLNFLYDEVKGADILSSKQLKRFEEILEKIESEVK